MIGSKFIKFIESIRKFSQTYPALTTSLATLISASFILLSVGVSYFSLNNSNLAFERSANLAALTIIQQLRTRFMDVNKYLIEYDINNYPGNKKHYSDEQRTKIRYYWEDVVFHEYHMCKEFQNGVLSEQWDKFYKGLIRNALDNEILRQEYAYMRKYRSNHKSDFTDRFFSEIDKLNNKIDWDKALQDRANDIKLSEKINIQNLNEYYRTFN